MKLKNLTMAIMVASLGAASFAAQAETSFYGSARVGLFYSDPGDGADATTTIKNASSRMGFKGQLDLENGLTAFGHYEFAVDADSSDNSTTVPVVGTEGIVINDNNTFGLRKAYVGLKGDFGRIRLGQDSHTYTKYADNTFQPWWDGGYGVFGSGRTGEALSYDKSFGNANVGLTAYANDDIHGDGFELGGDVDLGSVNLMAAVRDTDATPEPLMMVGAKGSFGPVGLRASYFNQDDVGTGVDVYASYDNLYLAWGQKDFDAGNKPSGVTLGYTHNIGPKTLMWFEISSKDADDGSDNNNAFQTALKYDF